MQPINGFSNVPEAGEFPRLTEGGYVVKITKITDKPEKQYLEIEYDIAVGEFKDYYKDLNERAGFWGGTMFRSYKDKALGMFKGFLAAIDKSNGTDFVKAAETGLAEQQLLGKRFGVVLGWELYDKNNGEEGKRLTARAIRPVQDIVDGNYKVPEILDRRGAKDTASAPSPVSGFKPVEDSELPF